MNNIFFFAGKWIGIAILENSCISHKKIFSPCQKNNSPCFPNFFKTSICFRTTLSSNFWSKLLISIFCNKRQSMSYLIKEKVLPRPAWKPTDDIDTSVLIIYLLHNITSEFFNHHLLWFIFKVLNTVKITPYYDTKRSNSFDVLKTFWK